MPPRVPCRQNHPHLCRRGFTRSTRPGRFLKLDLGPMSRSRCSIQNFYVDLSQSTPHIMPGILPKKTLEELRNEAIAKLSVVVTTFAARRRHKSEKFFGRMPRSLNQTRKNRCRIRFLFHTTGTAAQDKDSTGEIAGIRLIRHEPWACRLR